MSKAAVNKASEVKVSNLTFSEPKKLPNGGYQIYLNNGYGPLYVQSPNANVLWDTKYYADNETGGKYTVQFSLTNMENDKSMKDFHDMLLSIDQHVIDAAYENRKDWFGAKFNKHSKETIESLYTNMVKVHVDKETGEPSGRFPPSFQFKIAKRDGVHQCKVYDNNRRLFNIDDENGNDFKSLSEDILVKNASMGVVLRCNGIWVINGKFGCTWRAEQLKVEVPEKALGDGYAFRDDDDDNMDVVEDDSKEEVAEVTPVEDSDSDSDSSDEEEVPVKKPVKKRGVKKQ